MTKGELVAALEKVPDHVQVYFVNKKTCPGVRMRYLDDELVPLRAAKVQGADFGVVNAIAYDDEKMETARIKVTTSKVILT